MSKACGARSVYLRRMGGLVGLLLAAITADAQTNLPSVGLQAYRLKHGPLTIAQVADNASGLAFDPRSGTLFLVLNKPTQLVQLDPEGKTLRTIPLQGFDDTEDVVYVGGNTFAVVEERRRNVCFFPVDAGTTAVSYSSALRFLVDPVDAGNSGLEGIAYDSARRQCFVVKEKTPRRIYKFARPTRSGERLAISRPWDIEKEGHGCRDLSAVYFHAASGHLLLLSDESRCVVECTPDGHEIARLPLRAGSAGLPADLVQPEGITLDAKGAMYICCEPNLLYIFEHP